MSMPKKKIIRNIGYGVVLTSFIFGLIRCASVPKGSEAFLNQRPSGFSNFLNSFPQSSNLNWNPPKCLPAGMLQPQFNGNKVVGCGGAVTFSYGRRCGDQKVAPALKESLAKVIVPCIQVAAGGCKKLDVGHMGVHRHPSKGKPSCHHEDNAIDLSSITCDGKTYTAVRDKQIFRYVRGCLGAHGLPTVFDNASHHDHLHISGPGCSRNPGRIVKGKGLDQATGGLGKCTEGDAGDDATQKRKDSQ